MSNTEENKRPVWERGKNWYRRVKSICDICGGRKWSCSPCVKEHGIQCDIYETRCRNCPLSLQEKKPKHQDAYVKTGMGVWINMGQP